MSSSSSLEVDLQPMCDTKEKCKYEEENKVKMYLIEKRDMSS